MKRIDAKSIRSPDILFQVIKEQALGSAQGVLFQKSQIDGRVRFDLMYLVGDHGPVDPLYEGGMGKVFLCKKLRIVGEQLDSIPLLSQKTNPFPDPGAVDLHLLIVFHQPVHLALQIRDVPAQLLHDIPERPDPQIQLTPCRIGKHIGNDPVNLCL